MVLVQFLFRCRAFRLLGAGRGVLRVVSSVRFPFLPPTRAWCHEAGMWLERRGLASLISCQTLSKMRLKTRKGPSKNRESQLGRCWSLAGPSTLCPTIFGTPHVRMTMAGPAQSSPQDGVGDAGEPSKIPAVVVLPWRVLQSPGDSTQKVKYLNYVYVAQAI